MGVNLLLHTYQKSMAAQQTDQEPSIEEILSSIRQIISDEDELEEKTAASVAVKENTPNIEASDEVIELTQKISDDKNLSEPQSFEIEMRNIEETAAEREIFTPDPEPTREALVDLSEQKETPPPAPKIEKMERMESAVADDTLLTNNAAEAVLSGFSELARKTAVEYNGITLEEIVRTELKPMLREWLDRHLPSLIERLVQEELERISKRVLEE